LICDLIIHAEAYFLFLITNYFQIVLPVLFIRKLPITLKLTSSSTILQVRYAKRTQQCTRSNDSGTQGLYCKEILSSSLHEVLHFLIEIR